MASARQRSWVAALVLSSACQTAPEVEPDLDADYFRCRVQPVLETRCSMLECHGTEERPLRIFARNRLRLDADPVQLNLPMTQTELDANFDSAFTFTSEPPADSFLAAKPLDEKAGGYYHDGRELYLMDDVFVDTEDEDYKTLIAWMEGDKEDPMCSYAGLEAPDPGAESGDTG